MLVVYAPNNFIPERTYIMDVLLKRVLGLSIQVNFEERDDYLIKLDTTGKSISFKDCFFREKEETEGYLHQKNIPSGVRFVENRFTVEKDIPVIFGTDYLEICEEQVICGIDVFASSFFMLTRWEEYVNIIRDHFNRFPVTASLAFKNEYLHRPVVNEYVEMTWNILRYLDSEISRKAYEFELVVTHDVDQILLWKNGWKVLRTVAGDLSIRKDLSLGWSRWKQYQNIQNGIEEDPYDSFDEIMDLSEDAGVKSRFYFMSGGTTKYDNDYSIQDPKCLNLIKKIKDRGHIIGFHPSFDSYINGEQWKKEKDLLSEVAGLNITEGRQHYLRFEVPYTWRIWERNGMKMDSTLGYPEKEGFRCGTSFEFPVFDILNRKTLNLLESPLIFMEASFDYTKPSSLEDATNRAMLLKEKVKQYGGKFNFLWHNSNLNHGIWKELKPLYKKLVVGD